jgi:hypothetical protein
MRLPRIDLAEGYAAAVPQTTRQQLLTRLLCLGLSYLLSQQAKRTAGYASQALTAAIGPSAKLPTLTTPGQRRRARAALEAAALVVDQAPADLDDEPVTTKTVCAVRFYGAGGSWQTCMLDFDLDHRHANTLMMEDQETFRLRVLGAQPADVVADGEQLHEHQHAESEE